MIYIITSKLSSYSHIVLLSAFNFFGRFNSTLTTYSLGLDTESVSKFNDFMSDAALILRNPPTYVTIFVINNFTSLM